LRAVCTLPKAVFRLVPSPDDHGNDRYRNTGGEKPYSIAVAGVIEKECRSDAVASLRIAIWRDGAARCSVPKNERAPAIAGAFR
jgi:hypothetical protein